MHHEKIEKQGKRQDKKRGSPLPFSRFSGVARLVVGIVSDPPLQIKQDETQENDRLRDVNKKLEDEVHGTQELLNNASMAINNLEIEKKKLLNELHTIRHNTGRKQQFVNKIQEFRGTHQQVSPFRPRCRYPPPTCGTEK